ncbi:Rieske 2Fe-2S domain-containing protein [Polaribacter sp. IC073]|uniref:Rieske 2Fe-2S domain-containing protein n=1 Tax=Polaribacter sp. IC073 TaxID=2508540 RepID=UPI0011BDF52F|nr:Rieske 2Fe-2S domain-containing protein [Polaribacter sp. IC073]TXD47901.1 Rieske 2Fe-2S domain-containing protein [Polaribacter sp. IC073]
MFKKALICILLATLLSCEDNTRINDCFRGIYVSELIEFRLPIYQKLIVNGGSLTSRIDGRLIHIIRNRSSDYIAFDLECPSRTCKSPLDISNLPTIICPCDNKKYNYLEGGRLIGEEGCSMLMYSISPVGTGAIQIRN